MTTSIPFHWWFMNNLAGQSVCLGPHTTTRPHSRDELMNSELDGVKLGMTWWSVPVIHLVAKLEIDDFIGLWLSAAVCINHGGATSVTFAPRICLPACLFFKFTCERVSLRFYCLLLDSHRTVVGEGGSGSESHFTEHARTAQRRRRGGRGSGRVTRWWPHEKWDRGRRRRRGGGRRGRRGPVLQWQLGHLKWMPVVFYDHSRTDRLSLSLTSALQEKWPHIHLL